MIKKNRYKIILILLSILIIISLLIIFIKIKNSDDEYIHDSPIREDIVEMQENTKGKIQTLKGISDYGLAKVCIQKFYSFYSNIFNEDIINSDSDIEIDLKYYKTQLYNLLSKEYIQNHNITEDNIDSKFEYIPEVSVEIYNIYSITNYENVTAYFVSGLLRETNTQSRNFEIVLYVDAANQSFEVTLDNVLEKDYASLNDMEDVNFEIPESVENRDINTYNYIKYTYDTFAENQFDNIRNLLLYNVDLAYNMLSDDDKSKFGSVDGLKQYVDNNKKELFLLSLKMSEEIFDENDLLINMYGSNSKFIFTCYCNDFSTLKFSIEEI